MSLTVLISLVIFDSLLLVPFFWNKRRIFAVMNIGLTIGLTGLLLYSAFMVFWLPILICWCFVNGFRVLNMFRIIKARMHSEYLKRSTQRSTVTLMALTIVTYFLGILFAYANPTWILTLFVIIQLLALISMVVITLRNIQGSRYKAPGEHYADRDLPTVTVAIPARNETEDLEICIRSLLGNDYPKLEILVLDDCSQDNTSDIIKKFAHDGVRFIKGSQPNEKWLPKNYAYQRLFEEASGAYILFCGVDTRFGNHTIHTAMEYIISNKLDMVSVLPKRLTNDTTAAFIQPMRYWWELSVPRKLFKKPPVLSSCWVIRKDRLKLMGGFKSVARTILPERYFARELLRTNSYRFLRANELLDVQTNKSLDDQKETAVRVRYPQLHKRPELVLLLTTIEGTLLLGPFVLLIAACATGHTILVLAASPMVGLVILNHVIIVTISNPSNVPIALINFPLVVMTELYLGYESMLRYEFGTVTWKERNICIPVMHVIPSLPKLNDHH